MKIKDRLAKLIEVKSLITLMFSVCLSIAFLMDKVDVKDYITVCMTGLTFFFGYQNNKKNNEKGE